MFWITNIKETPLVEIILENHKKKTNYPCIHTKDFSNNLKFNNKIGVFNLKENQIIWDDSTIWIKAPKNIEYVQGKFKNIYSLVNLDIQAPTKLFFKNNYHSNYVNGRVTGIGNKKNHLAIQIGEKYYSNIHPGVLKIRLQNFYEDFNDDFVSALIS